MAKILHTSKLISTTTIAPAVTFYYPVGCTGTSPYNATEINSQRIARTAGYLSNLSVKINANSLSGACTVRFRNNSADGNQVVSISAAATGTFEDSTNTDTVTLGNPIGYSLVTAAGTGTITGDWISTFFAATTDTAILYGNMRPGGRANATASTTVYIYMSSNIGQAPTEVAGQTKVLIPGTLKNFQVYVSANTRSDATVYFVRKNTADGNQTISVSAAATGTFEDTSNTDALVANDLINYSITLGAGTGSLTTHRYCTDFISTERKVQYLSGATSGALLASTTYYSNLQGAATHSTTEALNQTKSFVTGKASNLAIYLSSNAVTATSTYSFRKNGVTGNQAVSISSSATGYFEDTSNTDVINGTDVINTILVTGGSGSSMVTENGSVVILASDISFNNASNSGYQAASSSYSWSHVCTGDQKYLVVGVGMLSLAQTVSSITYNSVAMTFLGSQNSVTGAARVELWGLIAPSAGSNTIAVTLSGAIASAADAVSFNGVHQTSPTEGFNSAQATNVGAADATVDVTTVANDDWVIDIVATDDAAITVGALQTSQNNVTGAGGSAANSTEPKETAGAVTMSWTNVGALATWAIAAVGIRPKSAASASSPATQFAFPGEYALLPKRFRSLRFS